MSASHPSDPSRGATPQTLKELLGDRYPTLYRAALEVANDPDTSVVAGWVRRASDELDKYAAEQKSRRKIEEAIAVKQSYELAAALVMTLAGRA